MDVSPVLAKELAARRADFNGRVAMTRAQARGFKTDAFSAFLAGPLDAVVVAVNDVAPDRVTTVVDQLFDIALELVAGGHAGPGARHDTVNMLWSEVAPGIAPLIAKDATESLGALSNAAVYISGRGDVSALDWLFTLAELAPEAATPADLKNLTTLITWRSGAAHMREAALSAAEAIPGEVACWAVSAETGDTWPSVAERFRQNIWWRPDAATGPICRKVGKFTGFGGRLATPPVIRACEDGFLIESAGRHFYLDIDAFGETLHSASEDEFQNAKNSGSGPKPALKSGGVTIGDTRYKLDLPTNDLMLAYNADSVAVASPYSHAIRVFPRHAP